MQKLRIQTAKYHLENSRDPIEDITRRVGYENSCTFRRLFKRYTIVCPREKAEWTPHLIPQIHREVESMV